MFVLYAIIELIPVAWLKARMIQARIKGITYFRRRSDSLVTVDLFFSARLVCCISLSSRSACAVERERRRAAYAASCFPRRSSQRGDSATIKLPITNKIPGGRETQKMPRHAVFLKSKSFAA